MKLIWQYTMNCSVLSSKRKRRRRRCYPMPEKEDILLATYLKQLYLATIRECYQQVARTAQQESLSYTQYLLDLVELECTTRHNKRIERLLRESKLPVQKNIESFDLKRLPRKVVHQVNTLLEGSFVDHRENILLFGNPGSGKTHLVCAIGQELVRRGMRRVYFTPCSILVQELLLAKRQLQLFILSVPRYLLKAKCRSCS
jgi:DNA replication protein DnaC